MDYYAGGDLLTLISKYDEELPEDMCRFYTCQIVSALGYLHAMGYIHRDVKPDNILIDSDGHVRLADFGSCVRFDRLRRDGQCAVPVGTPDYICPEILKAMEGNSSRRFGANESNEPPYGFEVDFWSLGVVLYECLFGETPFYAESLIETYSKIMNYSHSFKFPASDHVSDEAKDLISKLICDQKVRYRQVSQFQEHSFFQNVDWQNIRSAKPPYQPNVSGPDDTSNFDTEELRQDKPVGGQGQAKNALPGVDVSKDSLLDFHLPFVGYTCTFTRNLKSVSGQDNWNEANESPFDSAIAAKVLFESISTNIENQQPKNTLPTSSGQSQKISHLESQLQTVRHEWADLTAKLGELRKEKASLHSRLKSKEDEVAQQTETMDDLRQQLRNVDKFKRQQIEQVISLQSELDRERQLRKDNQLEVKELEEKIGVVEEQLCNYQSIAPVHDEQRERAYVEQISELKQLLAEKQHQLNERNQQLVLADQQLKDVETQLQELQSERRPSSPVVPENQYMNTSELRLDASRVDSSAYSNTTWQERRSARVDKQELLALQLELQNELEHKQQVQSELTRLQREMDGVLSELADSRSEVSRLRVQQEEATAAAAAAAASSCSIPTSFAMSSEPSSQRQSLGLTNGPSILFQTQLDLQAKINAMQLSGRLGSGSDLSVCESPTDEQTREFGLISSGMDSFATSRSTVLSRAATLSDNRNTQLHCFITRTFVAPLKCFHCTSLMVGLVRQGLVCEVCGFVCHVNCARPIAGLSLPPPNPLPACPCDDSRQRPVGIDPQRGIGTAYEGFVKIPKVKGGVRKGWTRMFVVVCDFKLFLYDMGANSSEGSTVGHSFAPGLTGTTGMTGSGSASSGVGTNGSIDSSQPLISVNTLIDMRDEHFGVSGVCETDVIHASRKDVPCIFKVSTSMLSEMRSKPNETSSDGTPTPFPAIEHKFTQLLLAEREAERNKWVDALHELQRIIRRNKLKARNTLKAFKLLNSLQLPVLRQLTAVHCACVIDATRVLIGTDDGLVVCDLDIQTYRRVAHSKKALAVTFAPIDQLLVLLAGRQRVVRLLPTKALDHDNTECVKINETRGATCFAVCSPPALGCTFVCVASKKTLAIFEITRRRTRYCLQREIQSALNICSVSAHRDGELLAVGTCSNFVVYHVASREQPPLYLVNQECNQLTYLLQNAIEPLACYPVSDNEWILLFARMFAHLFLNFFLWLHLYPLLIDRLVSFPDYGVYVDCQGRRSRESELQLPSLTTSVATLLTQLADSSWVKLLLCFAATHVDVFDMQTAEWIQTINLKLAKSLQPHGIG
jgi:serine/threonine-protein kinase MRCK